MKARSCFLFALALGAGQLMSCQKGTRFEPALANSFFPLHPGLKWTYRVISESQGTSEIITDQVASTARIATRKTADQIESSYAGSNGNGKSTMLYMLEDGYITRVAILADRALVVFKEKGFLPQLLKPGLTWSNSLLPFGELPWSIHAAQAHRSFFEYTDVIVPAGHFSGCIRVETETRYTKGDDSQDSESRPVRYIDWYAPNIGLVKTQVMQSGFFGSEIAHLELLNFTDSPAKAAPHLVKTESRSAASTRKTSIASSGSDNKGLR